MTIGVGLAGYGLAGRVMHAPLIRAAGLSLRAVATSRTDAVRAEHPGAEPVSSFEALLARGDIALIVVATPNALHADQARAALEAGKHIVVDKPVTPTAAEARALAALAVARGLVAAAFHNRRWDSDFLTVKAALESGRLGEPVRFRNAWSRHRLETRAVWRETPGPGAGLLYDLGPHLIDQALVLFGRPDWVSADVFRQRPGEAGAPDDGFEILLGKGRLRVTVAACSLAAGPAREIRLDGLGGSFVKTGLDSQEDRLKAGADPRASGFGAEPPEQAGLLWSPDGRSERIASTHGRWTAFYDGVRKAVESGGPPPVTLAEAAEAIGVIEAAFESARSGRRIALPAA